MSDTTVTTQAPANTPAAPQIPAGETPIDTNQSTSPNPITNQAPERPPMSRRDAIKAAFDRATAQQDGKTAPAKADPAKAAKPAKAEVGHNNPPEAVDGDKPKLNLKKRPGDQDAKTLDNPAPQPRDRGRFAPREQAADAQTDAQTAQTAAQSAQKPAK